MPSNEQLSQDNNPPILDFIVPFDGTQAEIDSRERVLVAERFRDLIDDVFLKNAENVREFNSIPGQEAISVLLVKRIDEKSYWSLRLESKTHDRIPSDEWESAEEIKQQIGIQKIVDSKGRGRYSYRMGSDGVVRRYDNGDAYAKIKADKAAGIGRTAIGQSSTVEKIADSAKTLLDELINTSIPNSRLERSMGLNDQPIGMAEMQGLEKFILQGDIQARDRFLKA